MPSSTPRVWPKPAAGIVGAGLLGVLLGSLVCSTPPSSIQASEVPAAAKTLPESSSRKTPGQPDDVVEALLRRAGERIAAGDYFELPRGTPALASSFGFPANAVALQPAKSGLRVVVLKPLDQPGDQGQDVAAADALNPDARVEGALADALLSPLSDSVCCRLTLVVDSVKGFIYQYRMLPCASAGLACAGEEMTAAHWLPPAPREADYVAWARVNVRRGRATPMRFSLSTEDDGPLMQVELTAQP